VRTRIAGHSIDPVVELLPWNFDAKQTEAIASFTA
jgi:hypothetical protein